MTIDRRIEIGVLRQQADLLFERTRKVTHQLSSKDRDDMLKASFSLTLQNTYMLQELLAKNREG